MTWNHKANLFAMGIAIQASAGQFVLPTQNDLIGVANPEAGNDLQSTADPTQTGSRWEAPRIYLGETGTGGGTIPLRGPGGAAPPAGGAWPVGRILQACGFTEIVKATSTSALVQGGSTTSIGLAGTESAVDDALIGMPLQHANLGVGFRRTTLIRDYVGATRMALLAETMSDAVGAGNGEYKIPRSLTYLLGTMAVAPPLLSISVWRDRRRYDFVDCVITAWSIDIPVSNDANQSFPSLQFSFTGTPVDEDGTVKTTPSLPESLLKVPVPPAKGGKFYLDRIKLGHAGAKLNLALEAGAASNQNQDAGQDSREILSGTRTLDLDLNQSDVADFDLRARVKAQTNMPFLSTWGGGSGNNMGLMIQNIVLDPMRTTDRNGYVALTGAGTPTDVDKSVAFSIWWDD